MSSQIEMFEGSGSETTAVATAPAVSTMEAAAPAVPREVKKWEVGAGLGPRMAAKFNQALKDAAFGARTVETISGVHGRPETEHRFCSVQLFGGPTHPLYVDKLAAIQEEFGHVVTSSNYAAIVTRLVELERWFRTNPMVKDERITAEEHDKKAAARVEYERAEKAKREADEAKERHETAQARALYPWAQQTGSDYARGSANLKRLLSEKFPGIVFSVRSSSASMTNSIDVNWEMGPSEAAVKAISDQFQYSDFDGMQDMSVTREYGEGFRKWMGSAKWVSETRSIPGTVWAVLDDALKGRNVEFEMDRVYRIKQDLLGATSFPAGAEVTGVEADESESAQWGLRITYTVPEAPVVSTPSAAGVPGITVTRNAEKSGVEIRFSAKPSASVLERVKAAGFRWSRFGGCWYAKDHPAKLAFAYELAGDKAKANEEAHAAGARGMSEYCCGE